MNRYYKYFFYLKKYYNINLQDTNYTVPRFIMRDWYKLSFLNPKENGFMQWQEKMLEYKPKNCFKFPVSAFWNMNKFITTMKILNEHWNLKLRLDTEMEDIHKLFLKKVTFLSTKNRADDIIKAIKKNIDYDLSDIDTVEQAYISAWIEKNYKFVQVPLCNQFFKNTKKSITIQQYKGLPLSKKKFFTPDKGVEGKKLEKLNSDLEDYCQKLDSSCTWDGWSFD